MNNEIYPNPRVYPYSTKDPMVERGLTLRDHFAGQVMMGVFSSASCGGVVNVEKAVKCAYETADLMLKERIKNNDQNNEV